MMNSKNYDRLLMNNSTPIQTKAQLAKTDNYSSADRENSRTKNQDYLRNESGYSSFTESRRLDYSNVSFTDHSDFSPQSTIVGRNKIRRNVDTSVIPFSLNVSQQGTPSSQPNLVAASTPPAPPSTSYGGSSPDLSEALLLCSEQGTDSGLSSCSPDYSLDSLVRSLSLKCALPLPPPPSPSPPCQAYVRSPAQLFGDAAATSVDDRYECAASAAHTDIPPIKKPLLSFSRSPVYPEPAYSYTTVPSVPQPLSKDAELGEVETVCTWSGQLPPPRHSSPSYSCKIFVGGVPWDVTELALIQAFNTFGNLRIEWPGKDSSPSPPKGYVYIIFEEEENVAALLAQCSHDYTNGGSWYFRLSSRRLRSKEVQIIPWVLADSNYLTSATAAHEGQHLDSRKTVFVGALHGMLSAEGLAHIFSDLFGGVLYAGIDTDKHKYPIGSGRVTFNSSKAYMKAVSVALVEVKCQKFMKKVQVEPYLEDSLCSLCLLTQGPYFCRSLPCFTYFCRHCWERHHTGTLRSHKPLMKNNRPGGGPATRPTIFVSQSSLDEKLHHYEDHVN